MGKWILIFGTGYIKAEADEPNLVADDLIEENTAQVKKKKHNQCASEKDVLERECFGGTMKNADIAAAITRLSGAREVTTQDVFSRRQIPKGNPAVAHPPLLPGGGGGGGALPRPQKDWRRPRRAEGGSPQGAEFAVGNGWRCEGRVSAEM
jgi:hypothetical protein